jgi:hypothetical protein
MSSLANDAEILRKRRASRHAGCRPELTLRARRRRRATIADVAAPAKVGESRLKSIAAAAT